MAHNLSKNNNYMSIKHYTNKLPSLSAADFVPCAESSHQAILHCLDEVCGAATVISPV